MASENRKAIVERIQQLADANDGRITPDIVIKDARNKSSPLHSEFEWDIRKAASLYLLDQARALIASVEVIIRSSNIDVRCPAYIRDPSVDSKRQGYISVDKLRTQEDQARDALIKEFERVSSMLVRARTLAMALDLDQDVERIIQGVAELRGRIQPQPPAVM